MTAIRPVATDPAHQSSRLATRHSRSVRCWGLVPRRAFATAAPACTTPAKVEWRANYTLPYTDRSAAGRSASDGEQRRQDKHDLRDDDLVPRDRNRVAAHGLGCL
jgi:hypothetical protein